MKKSLVIIGVVILIVLYSVVFGTKVFAQEKTVTIVIDPGHGGKEPGAVNVTRGIVEKDINLKVARYLRSYLSEYEGVNVLMTHDGLGNSEALEFWKRGEFARANKADMLLSIHFNSSSLSGDNGTEAFVTANKSLPKYNYESSKLANLIVSNISSLGIRNRGVKTRYSNGTVAYPGDDRLYYSDNTVADYYGIIRYSMKGNTTGKGANLLNGEGVPVVLVEHCFIQGNDSYYADSEDDLKRLAKADLDAIVSYYCLIKKDSGRVKSVSLDKEKGVLQVGEKLKLLAEVHPYTSRNKKIIWSSSNNSIAMVDQNGEITGKTDGTVIITAKTEDQGKIATATIDVRTFKVTIDKKELNLIKGDKAKLIGVTSVKTDKQITWKSSNELIAKIDSQGIITTIFAGTVTITVTVSGVTDTSILNVSELTSGQKIEIKNLKEENSIISRIKDKTTINDFLKNIEISNDLEIVIKDDKNNIMLDKQGFIGTKFNICINEKTSKKTMKNYETVIFGDINKDGKISSPDYVLIKNHIMETKDIEKDILTAADVNRDGKISSSDYILIKNYIMKGIALKTE